MKHLNHIIAFCLIIVLSGCFSKRKTSKMEIKEQLLTERVDSLLSIMTLEEKVGQMNQYNGFWDVTEEARYAKFLEDKKIFEEEQGVLKAKKTTSGLQILTLKRGRGRKFSETKATTINYTISLADGKQIQTTEGKGPFVFTLSKQPMIAGVKEAILKMREGGKVRLFIPYYLGYGERAYGPFPAKSDIVFDLEIVEIAK